MRVSFVSIVERLPAGLGSRLSGIAAMADDTLHGSHDNAVSRRMTLASYAVRVASAAIAYVSQVLLARWMGGFEYGIFAAVWVGAVLLGAIAAVGFPTAVLRFVPEYQQRGQLPLLRGVIVGSRLHGFGAATVIAVVGCAGLWFFGDLVASYYLIPLYLGAVVLPLVAVSEIQDSIARSFNWATISLWPTFIVRPLLILVVMSVAILAGAKADAVTALASVIVATYVATIGQMIWLRRRIRTVVEPGPRTYASRAWFVLALPMFFVEGIFNLLINVDILMVSHFMAPDQVGVYFAASKTLALVHFVYYAVRAGGAARFSQYHAAGDMVRLRAFVNDTLHWTFWPSLAMVGIVLLLGKPLLMMFGPGFDSGYPLLPILSIGILARAAIGPAETLLIMAGEQRICAWLYGAALLLAVALNYVLIPTYGLYGAAWATTLTLIAESICLFVIAHTRLGIQALVFLALFRPNRTAEAS